MAQVQKRDSLLDLNRSAVSRYIQLATLFRQRIESGTWPVGAQIPIIDELVAECGVARATIRQALGVLEDEGLLARYRAKGTFVLRRAAEGLWCEMESDWQGLLTAREGAVIKLIRSELVSGLPAWPHRIGEPAGSYRRLRRHHWRDNRPYLVADVYVDAELARKVPKLAFTTQTAMRLAASLPGVEIADARQTLTVASADVEAAAALEVPLNAPVAHVHRSVVDQHGRLVLAAFGIYRGDVVRVDVKLK